MNKTIFRRYDIRGIVDKELLLEQMYDLGKAIAYVFLQIDSSVKRVLVGMDHRSHSPALKSILCDALQDSGLDVVSIGICSSPVAYFGVHQKKTDAGIMITASHNPLEYNGLKLFIGDAPVWGDQITAIYTAFCDKLQIVADKRGLYYEEDLNKQYVKWIVDHFSHLYAHPIKAIVDCGCATAATVFPHIIKRLSLDGITLMCDTVGGSCTHQADPTREENIPDLQEALVVSPDTHLGIAFDGDADRMGAMSGEGKLIAGDILLALFSQDIMRASNGDTNPIGIVYDIRSSDGLKELLHRWGATPWCAPAGNPNIKSEMKKRDALLGGELSCHFMFADRYFGYDDGMYAALRLLELCAKRGKTLSELVRIFPKKYTSQEIRITCDPDQIAPILAACKKAYGAQKDCSMSMIDGVRITCPYGWGLVRPSHTQPVVSLRFESDTAHGLTRITNEFFQLLSPFVACTERVT